MKEEARVLLIDDDHNVLSAYQRVLGRRFSVDLAEGGADGLRRALSGEPYAVVLSDYQMPSINGLNLLAKVREYCPNTVRALITGNRDVNVALKALNGGTIFRFLMKPCQSSDLIETIEACVAQHVLLDSERSFLETTLNEVVRVLIELVGLHNPQVLTRATRLRSLVARVARVLKLPDVWEFELAAALSQAGLLVLPEALQQKLRSLTPFSTPEREAYDRHPLATGRLLEGIPRLNQVARMISAQSNTLEGVGGDRTLAGAPRWTVGGQLLRVCADFEMERMLCNSTEAALQALKIQNMQHVYMPEVVQALCQVVRDLEAGEAGEASPYAGPVLENLRPTG
ncbi:MAG: HD domain-containing phosphohydrolase [Candidatus Eremiobacterota bacterium]